MGVDEIETAHLHVHATDEYTARGRGKELFTVTVHERMAVRDFARRLRELAGCVETQAEMDDDAILDRLREGSHDATP